MGSIGVPSSILVALSLVTAAACGAPRAPGWGPLAVVSATGDQARTEGMLRITDECVFVERQGERELLVWPADRTTWNPGDRTISFQQLGGQQVTLESGQAVVLGGGGSHLAEDGLDGERWASSVDWIQAPAAACITDGRWFVSDLL
jgi:hypothetical protein